MNVYGYIKSDCFRYKGCSNVATVLKMYCVHKIFRWQVAFRLCHGSGFVKIFGLLLWKLNRTKFIIQIPRVTSVGYGLYISHLAPIIVNPTAVVGNNCNLSQFLTIGANHGLAAFIGDCVYIGPNVCIVENVCIGNNVTIGAGSVVTKNIPENATSAGPPSSGQNVRFQFLKMGRKGDFHVQKNYRYNPQGFVS